MPINATTSFCHDPLCPRQPSRESAGSALRECHQRPFISAPYSADEQGRYRPSARIDQCPWAQGRQRCQLEKHDFRRRKTGPEVPLRVLRCHTHGHDFTVYPPGHVPYGRVALVPVDLQGEPIARDLPPPQASCAGTLFRGRPRRGRGPAVAFRAGRGRTGSASSAHSAASDGPQRPAAGTLPTAE